MLKESEKAFKSAGWPTSMALHGEDVVMNLFIFFVFADPVDGFAGRYQLEYTPAIPAGGLVGRAATSTEPDFKSGIGT